MQFINNPRILFWLIFLLIMVAPVIAGVGELAPYLFFAIAIPLIIYQLISSKNYSLRPDFIGKILLVVFAIQMILAAISARTPGDILFGLNFLPILLYIPILAILSVTNFKNPVLLFAKLALASSFIALVAALIYFYGFGLSRAGALRVNPLGLAGVAINSGFFALLGFKETTGTKKYLFLLGPLAALVVISITETRGLFLAFLPMTALAFMLLLQGKWRIWIGVGGALAVVIAALVGASIFGLGRWQFLTSIPSMLSGGELELDSSLSVRFLLLSSGWQAFLDAPWFGNGWANIINAILIYIPDGSQRDAILLLAHLHNDLLDFAVTGGVVGIATYLGLIIAPLVAVFRMPKDSLHFARLFSVSILTTSYAFRGLSDLMFGFEANSLYYIAFLAIFFGVFRQKQAS